MTSSPQRAISPGSWAAKRGLPSRSGDTSRTSTRPSATASSTSVHSSTLVELTVAARRPAPAAAAIWSRIRASSGDTTRVHPPPRSRIALVAAQYTADFPQPVACTTNTRARSSTRARTAARWSSRGIAFAPASATIVRSSASSAVLSASIGPVWQAGVTLRPSRPPCPTLRQPGSDGVPTLAVAPTPPIRGRSSSRWRSPPDPGCRPRRRPWPARSAERAVGASFRGREPGHHARSPTHSRAGRHDVAVARPDSGPADQQDRPISTRGDQIGLFGRLRRGQSG